MRPCQGRAILVRVDAAVEVIDLVKTFPAPGGGTLTAVDGISFTSSRVRFSASWARTAVVECPK